jgi:hypothetical protein
LFVYFSFSLQVTLNTPDYKVLQAIHAARRLYQPPNVKYGPHTRAFLLSYVVRVVWRTPTTTTTTTHSGDGSYHNRHPLLSRLPIDQYLELNRRFAEGYIRFNEHPLVKNSIKELYAYMKELKDNGLRDYQARNFGIADQKAHTRHDTTRHDTTRHDTTRHDTTRHDTTHKPERHPLILASHQRWLRSWTMKMKTMQRKRTRRNTTFASTGRRTRT